VVDGKKRLFSSSSLLFHQFALLLFQNIHRKSRSRSLTVGQVATAGLGLAHAGMIRDAIGQMGKTLRGDFLEWTTNSHFF
jgi:hypothetical protein